MKGILWDIVGYCGYFGVSQAVGCQHRAVCASGLKRASGCGTGRDLFTLGLSVTRIGKTCVTSGRQPIPVARLSVLGFGRSKPKDVFVQGEALYVLDCERSTNTRSCQHRNLSDLLVGQKRGNENIPRSTHEWNHRWPITRMKGLCPQDNSRSLEFACHFKSFYIYFIYISCVRFHSAWNFNNFLILKGPQWHATSMLRPLTMLSFRLVRGSTLLKKG